MPMSPRRPEASAGGCTTVATAAVVARIWRADLADPGWDRFQHVLSRDEEDKARRYRTAALAVYYRRCRSIVRLLLARHSGQDPAQIVLRYGWAGKPEAVGLACHFSHFNVTHAQSRALIVLSPYPVGIDIENTVHEHIRMEELADLICHPDEQALLATMAPARRREFLYRLWVRKEAYCKTLGTGLQSDLRQLRFAPTTLAGVVRVDDCSASACSTGGSTYYVRSWYGGDADVASLCLPLRDGAVVTGRLAPRDGEVAPLPWIEPPALVGGKQTAGQFQAV